TSTSIVVTPTTTTTYSVTGTNGTCTDLKTSQVTVTLTPNVSVPNQTICAAGTATLNASGAPSYSWSTGFVGNPLMVTPSSNTVYSVIGINGTCTDTETVSVTIGSSITIVPAATTPTICAGGTVGLSATGATTYTWNPGNINGSALTVTPSANTTYTVEGSNNGCNGTSTINISIITAPALNLTPSTGSICIGSSVTINASGYATYTWSPSNLNGSSQDLSPSANQVYTVNGTLGNCAGSSTALVNVFNYPTMNITGNTVICAGNQTSLTASGATTYTWSSGGSNAITSVNPNSTTSYTVTGFNSTCSGTAAITVSVNPNPTISVSTFTNPLCLGNGVNLTGSGATSYTWSTNSSFNPIYVTPTVTTTYTLTGAVNGCTSQAVFTQSVVDCSGGSVGVEENELTLEGLNIFPNPTNQFVNIHYKGANFNYTVFDNLGRVIKSEKSILDKAQFDLSNYAKGVYFIEISSDQGVVRKKLILD
ncbi:MAG: T9SS type A sorting domain-containing protein, partial [Bacteroidia bacterium]